ncbi:C40 family peptidase [Cellulomonas edaphi]|uniref:C40 family peptidase n=1 Tax=Cellulomonas edaphi TaxID=3053468 RepID=A0ABT7S4J0_9CELL|nr:C40 family peptidase [Cellulomons edaphi]MDM7830548.1 C40 family peptidase [Cellulomons edaphi]
MSIDPIAQVQARVQELRALLAGPSASAMPAGSVSGAATGATGAAASADFQAALAAASSQTSSGGSAIGTSAAGASPAALTSAPSTVSAVPSSTVSSAGSASDVTAQDLVATAKKYLGVPYVWGGESLAEGGLDCSGLVQRSLADLGITGVPRTAREQMHLGTAVPSMAAAKPGDLLVFHGGTHIGIYLGNGTMIDAPKPGKHVNIREVYAEPTAIRRILPQAGEVSQDASRGTDSSRLAWDLLSGAAA